MRSMSKRSPHFLIKTISGTVDQLLGMAEIDQCGKEFNSVESQQICYQLVNIKDLTREGREQLWTQVKECFLVVRLYLEYLYQKKSSHFSDMRCQKGIYALMRLAKEAVDKLRRCSSLFRYTYADGRPKDIREYLQLESFYNETLSKKMQTLASSEKTWESNFVGEVSHHDLNRLGIRDVKKVREDQDYDLFLVRQGDGTPFFDRNLLRHIKMIYDFDLLCGDGSDPLMKISLLIDEELQVISEEVMMGVREAQNQLYSQARNHLPQEVMVALMLAAKPANLLRSSNLKICTRYFNDFYFFFRQMLNSRDFKKKVKEEGRGSKWVQFVQLLCEQLFHIRGKKKIWLDYLDELSHQAGFNQLPHKSSLQTNLFFQQLQSRRSAIEILLEHYPNGPLFKALDIFRDQDSPRSFDPLAQGNRPEQTYQVRAPNFQTACLRFPAPIIQDHIDQAQLAPEFKAKLLHRDEGSGSIMGNCHLMINLQNGTSSYESARCRVLEKESRVRDSRLSMLTLPQGGEFYSQEGPYFNLEDPANFYALFQEQVKSQHECGFFFSKHFKKKELYGFLSRLLPLLHEGLFGETQHLTRDERITLIDLSYLFLALKGLDLEQPATLSFTCKDGLDKGSITSALFFTLIKLIKVKKGWSTQEQKLVTYLFFIPTLKVRERLISQERFARAGNVAKYLSHLLSGNCRKYFLTDLRPLFSPNFIDEIDLNIEPFSYK